MFWDMSPFLATHPRCKFETTCIKKWNKGFSYIVEEICIMKIWVFTLPDDGSQSLYVIKAVFFKFMTVYLLY